MVYHRTSFTSKSAPGVFHEVVVFYGGTLEKPNLTCTCPKFTMTVPHWCWHAERVWNEWMTMFQRMSVVHYEEIKQKIGWPKN